MIKRIAIASTRPTLTVAGKRRRHVRHVRTGPLTWASAIWRVEKRAMNESSRLSDVFFDWAMATVLEMAPVSWTVVRSFIQRWALLDLPSGSEDGSCGRAVPLVPVPAAPVDGGTADEGDASPVADDAPRAPLGLLRVGHHSAGQFGWFTWGAGLVGTVGNLSVTMQPIHNEVAGGGGGGRAAVESSHTHTRGGTVAMTQ